MNFVTAKRPADIKLSGIIVNFEHVNDSLKVVTLSDGKGGVCRFSAGSYESANVTVPAPPKMEKRYVMRADLPDVGNIARTFEHKHEAESAKEALQRVHGAEITITQEEVEIKDEATTKAVDDLPF